MNQIKRNHKEGGQILVILALALVGLLSFTALAVDLGSVFNDRRYDQNVADSASLAGGQTAIELFQFKNVSRFTCNTNGQWVSSMEDPAWVTKPAWLGNDATLDSILNAAIASAAANNKTVGYGLTTQNGVAIACVTDTTVTYGSYLDVKVSVSSITSTSFAQIFNGGPIRNSVEAVTRTYPRTPALGGMGLYAMDPTCAEGILINGGGNPIWNVQIDHGGAFSRSCISSTGHGSLSATTINCLKNDAHPDWCDPNNPNFSPTPTTVTTDPFKGSIPIPDCNDRTIAPAQTITGTTMSPGYYAGGLWGYKVLSLLPGLYCIAGDVSLNGGDSLTSIPDSNGVTGVTLVFMDGSFTATGNSKINITSASPDVTVAAAPNVVRGAAIIFSQGNNNTLSLSGTSDCQITGTVYAPESEIILGGTGGVPMSTQFIGFKFNYHGTITEHLNFNPDLVTQEQPKLSLYK